MMMTSTLDNHVYGVVMMALMLDHDIVALVVPAMAIRSDRPPCVGAVVLITIIFGGFRIHRQRIGRRREGSGAAAAGVTRPNSS